MKKLSIGKIDEASKAFNNIVVKDWLGNELNIKKNISYEEMVMFVNNVVNACFASNGDYIPENEDPAIRECVLTLYGNIMMPSNISHKYEILYCSGLYESIIEEINDAQYDSIVLAIHNKIDTMVEMNVQHIYTEINQVINSMNSLIEDFGKTFKGVTSDDVKNMLGAISSGKLDEGKLVEAYLKQTK